MKQQKKACKTAAPIFINAIKNMSLSDGFKILKGSDNAATNYLKEQTNTQLYKLFLPEVKMAIEKVKLTAYWEPLVKKYNQSTRISGKESIETDLNKYVTERAILGLFKLLAIQEKEIRKNPLKRTTDILKKVFSSLDP
jgi:enolase